MTPWTVQLTTQGTPDILGWGAPGFPMLHDQGWSFFTGMSREGWWRS